MFFKMADEVFVRECVRSCLDSLLPSLKIDSVTDEQFEALFWFILRKDVYVSLPTGSGKSLIFHLVPLVHEWMFNQTQDHRWIKDPIIVIICPLLTLMQDQVNMLTRCGKRASYIGGNDQSEEVLRDIEGGKYTYVFLSPESALSNERYRNMLSSKTYKDNMVGIVIDEVHCVTEWGVSNEKKAAFRKMLMKHFDTPLPSDLPSGHNCCDVCNEDCKCQGDSCDQDLHLPCDAELLLPNTNQTSRQVSQEQRDMLFHKLRHLQKQIMMKAAIFSENNTPILSCPTVFLEFGKEQINQIVEHSDILFTREDVIKHVDIWKRKHANAVLEILHQVFKDMESPMLCDEDDEESDDDDFENEWAEIMNDPSFLELLGQSQWEHESFTFTDEQDSIVEPSSS